MISLNENCCAGVHEKCSGELIAVSKIREDVVLPYEIEQTLIQKCTSDYDKDFFELPQSTIDKLIVDRKDPKSQKNYEEFNLVSYKSRLIFNDSTLNDVLLSLIEYSKNIYDYLPPRSGLITAGLSNEQTFALYREVSVRTTINDFLEKRESYYFDLVIDKTKHYLQKYFNEVNDVQVMLVYNDCKRSLIRYCIQQERIQGVLLRAKLIDLDEVNWIKKHNCFPNNLLIQRNAYPKNISELTSHFKKITLGEFTLNSMTQYQSKEAVLEVSKQILSLFSKIEMEYVTKKIDEHMQIFLNKDCWKQSVGDFIISVYEDADNLDRIDINGYDIRYMFVIAMLHNVVYSTLKFKNNRYIILKSAGFSPFMFVKYSIKLIRMN